MVWFDFSKYKHYKKRSNVMTNHACSCWHIVFLFAVQIRDDSNCTLPFFVNAHIYVYLYKENNARVLRFRFNLDVQYLKYIMRAGMRFQTAQTHFARPAGLSSFEKSAHRKINVWWIRCVVCNSIYDCEDRPPSVWIRDDDDTPTINMPNPVYV